MADDLRSRDVGKLVAAPLEAMIVGVGRSIAEAQQQMDAHAAASMRALGLSNQPRLELLRALGHQPTWYRIPEADVELTVALSLHAEQRGAAPARTTLYASLADAGFTNRYAYDLQAASTVRFKIVPVPAPQHADDHVVVPDLVGKRQSEATMLLANRGIPYTLKNATRADRWVVGMSLPAGALLARGADLTLRLGAKPKAKGS